MANPTRRGNTRTGTRASAPPPRGPRRPVQKSAPPPVGQDWLTSLKQSVQQDPRWILLPLRAYLGFTFVYAGLSKVADRSFLDASSPTSMHATLIAVKGQSPIGGLLGPVADHSFAFGVLMALGELAVGTGMLLGLFGRVAAAGGVLISLSLFLTVSWGASPWYTGADIVYAFAFIPLLLGGAGPLSADEWLANARRRDTGADPVVADRTRRVLLGGVTGIGALAALGLATLFRGKAPSTGTAAANAGLTSGAPSSPGPNPTGSSTQPSTQPSTKSSAAPAKGTRILAASAVPVGGAAATTDPKTGDDIYVLQLQPGVYTAVDRACPHQGCPVSFVSASQGFECPCHMSTFAPSGAVTQGPATSGLAKIPVARSGSDIVRT